LHNRCNSRILRTTQKPSTTEIGHSSLRMTERYTHFTPEQRNATAEKLAV
jgi:hypothetical protein